MRIYGRCLIRLIGLGAVTSISVSASTVLAERTKHISGWTLYEGDSSCSIGRIRGDSFIFFSISAEGRQFLRFHDKSWQFKVGSAVSIQLRAGDKGFDLSAKGAATTDGWPGFTASPQEDVLTALSYNDQGAVIAEGTAPAPLDLSGLRDAIPALKECAEPLTKRSPDQIPVKGPRLLKLPTISRDDFPRGAVPNGPLAFKLTIGTNGLPTDCSIIQTSGSAAVDNRVCALLKEGARFQPALNDSGQPVPSSWQQRLGF